MARDVQQENIYERKTKVGITLETDLEYRTGMQSFAVVNWRKIRKALSIMSLLFRFHALRGAPKTIGHEVKAVCVKITKHLTTLIKNIDYFVGHQNVHVGLNCIFQVIMVVRVW